MSVARASAKFPAKSVAFFVVPILITCVVSDILATSTRGETLKFINGLSGRYTVYVNRPTCSTIWSQASSMVGILWRLALVACFVGLVVFSAALLLNLMSAVDRNAENVAMHRFAERLPPKLFDRTRTKRGRIRKSLEALPTGARLFP